MAQAQTFDQDYMQNSSVFSSRNLLKLKEIMVAQEVDKDSFIYQEGDLAGKMYFIYKGRAKITKLSESGKEYILYLFQEGDFLCQPDPYQDVRHSFTAKALEHCSIGVIQKEALELLLWQHGDLALEFVKWMGLMHRLTQTKFRDLIMYGKPGALCSTLIRLSNSYGSPTEKGIIITFKLTNSELADYIGCARESVNRMLSDLKKAGAIMMNNGYITITNMTYLKNICKCENCPKEICRI